MIICESTLRDRFADILAAAEAGASFTVTRNGVAVARLILMGADEAHDRVTPTPKRE